MLTIFVFVKEKLQESNLDKYTDCSLQTWQGKCYSVLMFAAYSIVDYGRPTE